MTFTAFTYGEHRYRVPKLNAFEQHACLHLVAPVIGSFKEARRPMARGRGADQAASLVTLLTALDEDRAAGLLNLCLARAERMAGETWAPVWDADAADTPLDDLSTVEVFGLAARVVIENLGAYLTRTPAKIQAQRLPMYFDRAELPDGMSWLLTPAERGLCKYESLKDGTLDLCDVALMNEQLAVSAENESRAHEAAKEQQG